MPQYMLSTRRRRHNPQSAVMPEKSWRARPWTISTAEQIHRRADVKINIPKINTYFDQIQECQEMYARLKLDKPRSVPVSPLPIIRSSTTLYPANGKNKLFSARSAPPGSWIYAQAIGISTDDAEEQGDDHSDETNAINKDDHGRKRVKMNPLKLCEHLETQGFGTPEISTVAHKHRRLSVEVPVGVRARTLPKNPSKREKIKGRARLDYEMANMRAEAFCEQQAPRMFRTASANNRNRDVQFVEEEMREQWQKEQLDDNDDAESVTMVKCNRDELFRRIEAWMEDVDRAWGADGT